MSFAGRVAVVTGGGRGIGAGVARGLATAGAHVVVAGRNEEALAAVVDGVRAAGGAADAVRCDVTVPEDALRLAAEVRRLAGPASIVVNNAGVARSARLRDTSDELWRETLETNLGGPFRVTRAFHDDVAAAGKGGRFVYIGSTASRIGFLYTGAYCAAKHGLLGLARSLALELAAKGVTVNVVCPGWVDTDMAHAAIERIVEKTGRSPAEARGELERMSPARRLMTVDEVVAVTLFLCSDAAGAVNGQAWDVDGGQVMA